MKSLVKLVAVAVIFGLSMHSATAQTADEQMQEFVEGKKAFDTGDYAKAFEWWTKAANKGNAEAMYWVGNLYEAGFGVAKNDDKAREWWAKAKEKGSRKAACKLEVRQCEVWFNIALAGYVYSDPLDENPQFQGKNADVFVNWINAKIDHCGYSFHAGRLLYKYKCTISTTGEVTVELLVGPSGNMEKQLREILQSSPKWKPAKNKNETVAVDIFVYIRLDKKEPLDF